jgi:hypothetical protein
MAEQCSLQDSHYFYFLFCNFLCPLFHLQVWEIDGAFQEKNIVKKTQSSVGVEGLLSTGLPHSVNDFSKIWEEWLLSQFFVSSKSLYLTCKYILQINSTDQM